MTLLAQVGDDSERAWLASQAVQQGWSRAVLQSHIKTRLYDRQGQAVTNFEARLPAPQAGPAKEALMDPYLFDFLGLGEDAMERDIESALVRHITRFLLELGTGFAFVGRPFRLEAAQNPFHWARLEGVPPRATWEGCPTSNGGLSWQAPTVKPVPPAISEFTARCVLNVPRHPVRQDLELWGPDGEGLVATP